MARAEPVEPVAIVALIVPLLVMLVTLPCRSRMPVALVWVPVAVAAMLPVLTIEVSDAPGSTTTA